MLGLLVTILTGYLGVLAIMYVAQRSLMYKPGPLIGSPSSHGVSEMEILSLTNEEGVTITSW